jgi:N-acetylglucosamine-6-phosphate deacetylase
MASLTPAERAGVDSEVGSLAVGKRADVVVLDSGLSVRRVFIGGEEFPSAAPHSVAISAAPLANIFSK